MSRLTIRAFKPADVESIVRYFFDASPTDLERMGVEASKLPVVGKMRSSLMQIALTPMGEGSSCYLIWEVDSKAIGHTSLKDIIPGKCGGMHLHMWNALVRGKGFGAELFCRSALEFYRIYQLPLIICEPRASNPMPNKMLQKIGFPLVRTYIGRSSDLSAETELNTYEVRRDVAELFLSKRLLGLGSTARS